MFQLGSGPWKSGSREAWAKAAARAARGALEPAGEGEDSASDPGLGVAGTRLDAATRSCHPGCLGFMKRSGLGEES